MPNKYCCHGDCKSDSRKDKDLLWARFPPKTINPEHAKRWAHLMCRKDFTAETDTEICSSVNYIFLKMLIWIIIEMKG